jgi:hypothetical protein
MPVWLCCRFWRRDSESNPRTGTVLWQPDCDPSHPEVHRKHLDCSVQDRSQRQRQRVSVFTSSFRGEQQYCQKCVFDKLLKLVVLHIVENIFPNSHFSPKRRILFYLGLIKNFSLYFNFKSIQFFYMDSAFISKTIFWL